MPEATPLPDYSANPSGIGAAVFQPVKSPLDVELENLKGEDDAYASALQIAAKRKAQSAKALSDLSPDLNGILDSDSPYFQKGANDILALAQKGVSTGKALDDPSNPYYWQIKQAQNNLNSDVQASKNQKQQLATIWQRFDPTKHDADYFDKSIANWRSQATPTLRSQLNLEQALKTKAPDVINLLRGEIAKVPIQETDLGEMRFPSGATGIKGEKGRDPKVAEETGRASFNDPVNSVAWQTAFDNLPEHEKMPYKLSAAAKTVQNQLAGINSQGIPAQEYAADLGKKFAGGKEIIYKGHSFDPLRIELQKEHHEESVPDKRWQLLYRQAAGDPTAFDIDQSAGGLSSTEQQGGANIPVPGTGQIFTAPTNAKLSLENSGDYIGQFLARAPKMYQGAPQKDDAGNVVYDNPKPVSNYHYATKIVDGKPYVINSESLYNYGLKNNIDINQSDWNKYYTDPEAWQPMTVGYVKKFESGQSGKERIENQESHNRYLRQTNALEQGKVNVSKAAGVNVPQQQQPQPQKPAVKTINRSDIPTKAAAAGYTPQEYEQLLIKNGVTIK